MLLTIGADLWQIVLDRLVARGLIRRRKSRILGVFRTTTRPATDGRHEAQLRSRIHQVLVDPGGTRPTHGGSRRGRHLGGRRQWAEHVTTRAP
ncbi:GPP34 family phosphoprotein [Ornithinimicrobium ciconiae]|uniref:GPP34 family phosphoprotein n=1 Tax=Ornithinimicrobium ciconiae TaxID=2594265 RepID=A0A516G7T8_9MICO|nr:GPP34 family phosphoprotein [Ornithinimicrobium ciconiae]QDO87593.1 GPP34 family phosphoprotein [Ornithinimicrobium ciconiae]